MSRPTLTKAMIYDALTAVYLMSDADIDAVFAAYDKKVLERADRRMRKAMKEWMSGRLDRQTQNCLELSAVIRLAALQGDGAK